MRIIVSSSPGSNVIARGEILGRLEGEFFQDQNGQVLYRPLWEKRLWFVNVNRHLFEESAAVWNRYCHEISQCANDAEQEEIARQLRAALTSNGAFDGSPTNNLWAMLLEQVDSGLL
jgi:hypothetical protein